MSTFVRTPGTRCASSRHTVEARTRAKSRSTCRGPVPAPPTQVMVSLEESVPAKSLICRRCAVDNLVESGGKGRNTTERVGMTVVVVVDVVGATVVIVVVVGATVVVVDVDVVATGTIAGATVVVAESPPPPPDVGAAVVVGAIVVVVVVVGATVVVVVVVGATVVDVVVVVVGATVVVVVVVVGAVGVAVSLVSETTPSPIALRALTRNRYDVAFVSPDTDAEVTTDTPSAKVVQLEPFVEYSTM